MRLDLLHLTPELAALGLALLVFLGDLFTKDGQSKRYLGWLSAAGYAALLGLLLSQGVPQGAPTAFGGMFIADGLAYVFKVVFVCAALLTALASINHLDERNVLWQGEYYFLLSMVTVAMMAMASAGDLLSLYVALEFNSLGFYALVSILKGRSLVSSEAGIKYLLLGAVASALLLYGVSLVYGLSGTLSLPDLAAWVQGLGAASPEALVSLDGVKPTLYLAVGLIVAGLAFKVSLAPFHMWAPDVYQAAPTPITAFLSVASKAAGMVLVVRVLHQALGGLAGVWVKLLMLLMALTFVWANVVALKQKDFKRLLAYSSVAQAGYLMIGVVALSEMGLSALMYYTIVYLFTNMAAFQVAQLVSASSGRDDLGAFKGLAVRSPGLAIIMMSAMLSLAGIPPFGGFFGKYYLFASGVEQGLAGRAWLLGLVGFAVVMSIVALFYYLVVVKAMYIEASEEHAEVKVPIAARLSLAVCMGMILFTGIYPTPILAWLQQALQ
jgi:NADH-quinone oxidoreductase subunit N